MSSGSILPAALGRQRGIALYVGLIMLFIVSLFGIVTINTSVVESKMASATRNFQLARMAASSAMNEARNKIETIAKTDGSAGVCVRLNCLHRSEYAPETPREFMQTEAAISATNPYRFDFTSLEGEEASSRLAENPGYVIEDLGAQANTSPSAIDGTKLGHPTKHVFRVTAIGTGAAKEFQYAMEEIQLVDE